ncbi:MAG: ABC transporter substrate-binding protein [Methanobacterium sp.]|nr:ABC transporter substrate-binding protein [Methanobacterium sp.]
MTNLKVMLEYFHPWPNAAGFYFAREQGWYREADLDVEFVLQDPERGDALAYLVRRDVDFGICPSNRLLVRRDRGDPVFGGAAGNHRGLEVIQTIRSTGISRPRDLAGKRLALNPTPRGLAMVRHLVAADGGNPDAVVIVDAGTRELTPDLIAQGTVDATFGSYWAWEVLMETAVADRDRIIWPVDTIGAPPYHSYLLGAHQGLLADNPAIVQTFLGISARGYLAVSRAPEKALPIFERITPYFPENLLQRSLSLIAPTWLHDGRWGQQRQELLEPYARWLSDNGILSRADVWRDAVTNSFLPVEVRL